MDEFAAKVLNFIQKNRMVKAADTVVAGFSGGADSTALLSVLWELKDILDIRILALHLNHGIRQEAKDDERFCENFCSERGIPLKVVTVDVVRLSKEKKLTLEEAGRRARYEAFENLLREEGGGIIAVAHHQNDVAETLLMNLSRGSGLRGGSGIRPKRDNIIRPLLCVSKEEIVKYLEEKNISFCTDRTNLENDHTRNYVRNVILPELTSGVNARSVEHIARAAASFEKAEDFVRGYAKEIFDKVVVKNDQEVSFDISLIADKPGIIRENIVLLCFEELVKNRKDIGAVHVEMVLELMESLEGTVWVDLPYAIRAVRSYNILSLGKIGNEDAQLPDICPKIAKGVETEVDIPGLGRAGISVFPYDKTAEPPTETYTKWLDYGRIQEIVFRTRRPGDHIFIEQDGEIRKKELRKYLTDEKVPVKERDRMYLMADGDSILWIPGYRISAKVKVSKDTESILAIKITNGGNTYG